MDNKRSQVVLTKSNRMTPEEKTAFDLIQAWGCHRFSLLTGMLQLLFTDEEMKNPGLCKLRLLAMVEQKFSGSSVVSAPSPAPTATVPSYKEDTPAPVQEQATAPVQPTIVPMLPVGNSGNESDGDDLNALWAEIEAKENKEGGNES